MRSAVILTGIFSHISGSYVKTLLSQDTELSVAAGAPVRKDKLQIEAGI